MKSIPVDRLEGLLKQWVKRSESARAAAVTTPKPASAREWRLVATAINEQISDLRAEIQREVEAEGCGDLRGNGEDGAQ